ncbi:MAG: hypothetical protein GC137_03525 [Alphaproteobacteria bacterium]|nr:hypothetical protein [Alphaproteobacteria bacterium]
MTLGKTFHIKNLFRKMDEKTKQEKRGRAIFLTALAAGLGYGAWAFYANLDHGFSTALMSSSIQAIYAFISTLTITHVARYVFLHYKCGYKGILAGFVLSFLVMLAIPLVVHNYFGTPNIWQTILPGLIWGSIYLMGFLISLDIKLRINAKQEIEIEIDESIL